MHMPLEDLYRLSKFELSLMLIRESSKEKGIPRPLQNATWEQAILDPNFIPQMEWIDFNKFRKSVIKVVSDQLKKTASLGKKVREIICDDFEACKKLHLRTAALALSLSQALKDYFGELVANIITVIVVFHLSLDYFCRCDLMKES